MSIRRFTALLLTAAALVLPAAAFPPSAILLGNGGVYDASIVAAGVGIYQGYCSGSAIGLCPGAFGIISQDRLPPPLAVVAVITVSQLPLTFDLQVSGFASDPGKLSLTSVAVGGYGTFAGNSATYSYFGGVASWQWSAGSVLTPGRLYTVRLTRTGW